jgi:hypothetical protein
MASKGEGKRKSQGKMMSIDLSFARVRSCIALGLLLGLASQEAWAQESNPANLSGEAAAATPDSKPPAAATKAEPSTAKSGKGKGQSTSLPKLTPEQIAALPPRTGAWSLGFDLRQLNVTPSNRAYKQRGIAPDINVGYVHIAEDWWASAIGHLPFGPTSQHYPDSPPIDFEGYGFSAVYGRPFSGNLRKASGDLGAEIGLEVFELVGRSFRRQVLPDKSVSDAWVMKTRWTALTPALTMTFLKPARPQGSRPEWLMTRIEGYRFSLGAVIPVQNSWDLRFEKNSVGQGDRGKWKGVFGLLAISTWLGI